MNGRTAGGPPTSLGAGPSTPLGAGPPPRRPAPSAPVGVAAVRRQRGRGPDLRNRLVSAAPARDWRHRGVAGGPAGDVHGRPLRRQSPGAAADSAPTGILFASTRISSSASAPAAPDSARTPGAQRASTCPSIGQGFTGMLLRGLLCGVFLLPPTMLMGATLPAVARWVDKTPRRRLVARLFLWRQHRGSGVRLASVRLLSAACVTTWPTATYVAVAVNAAVGGSGADHGRTAAPMRSAGDRAKRPGGSCSLQRDRLTR